MPACVLPEYCARIEGGGGGATIGQWGTSLTNQLFGRRSARLSLYTTASVWYPCQEAASHEFDWHTKRLALALRYIQICFCLQYPIRFSNKPWYSVNNYVGFIQLFLWMSKVTFVSNSNQQPYNVLPAHVHRGGIQQGSRQSDTAGRCNLLHFLTPPPPPRSKWTRNSSVQSVSIVWVVSLYEQHRLTRNTRFVSGSSDQ